MPAWPGRVNTHRAASGRVSPGTLSRMEGPLDPEARAQLSNYPKTAESAGFAEKLKLTYSPSAVSRRRRVSFQIVIEYSARLDLTAGDCEQ
jgi:hypothetical protein